ncbi:kinase-like domain-containing protein [Chaetomium strumarium]|uniref:Kinase-like domain-containing protein n=1 Tax=Chaetomium strumarium TaxID=1170767 RepID=A0AAJ0GTT4_9PEZI|nr:kinase-like domain-containing protein [Chaetomium strumarium]
MTNDEHTTVRHYYQYSPPGVKRVIKSGSSAWIGEVDDSAVLKYPLAASENLELLEAERKMLEAIPPHKNILGFKGSTDAGIYLERAPNGTVAEYILDSGKPLSLQQRLAWCRETAEAPTNLLLDKDLHVKLSDFQGKLLAEDGTVLVDGRSMEPYRFSLPRDDFRADVKTDLFALGCTIYFILLGHTIFPDIDDRDDEAYAKVEERLAKKEWPRVHQVCSAVTLKCWEQQYESAADVVRDLEAIEREHRGRFGIRL